MPADAAGPAQGGGRPDDGRASYASAALGRRQMARHAVATAARRLVFATNKAATRALLTPGPVRLECARPKPNLNGGKKQHGNRLFAEFALHTESARWDQLPSASDKTTEGVASWGNMVPVERIELPTFGLQNRCSTAELNRRIEAIGGR